MTLVRTTGGTKNPGEFQRLPSKPFLLRKSVLCSIVLIFTSWGRRASSYFIWRRRAVSSDISMNSDLREMSGIAKNITSGDDPGSFLQIKPLHIFPRGCLSSL